MDQEDDVDPWREPTRRRRGPMPLWQELPLLLIIAFGIAVLVRAFLVQAFYIPSGSMEQTLNKGDRVLVNKVVYDTRDPRRGEVVVFRGTDIWAPELAGRPDPGFFAKLGRTLGDLVGVNRPDEKDFIKRVIGLPGDRVACCDHGRITVNGVPLDEPYIFENSPDVPPIPDQCGSDVRRSRRFAEVVVPPGQLFVMGDHRLTSIDARCRGTIPIDNVIGRAFVVVWPQARWGSLPVPSTFAHLPEAAALPAPSTVRRPAQPAASFPTPGCGTSDCAPGSRQPSLPTVVLPVFWALLRRRRAHARRSAIVDRAT